MTTTNRAWGYVRVSTARQLGGNSPAAQIAAIVEFAERRGLDLGDAVTVEIGGQQHESRSRIVVEGASAFENDFRDRPGGDFISRKLARGDTVIFTRLDRGFRRTIDALVQCEAWDKAGVRVVFATMDIDTSTAAGRLLLRVLASVAEMESDIRSDRQLESRAALLAKNPAALLNGKRAWAGFRFEGEDQKTRTLVPDDSRRWLMDQVYELWHDGLNPWKISEHLNRHRRNVPREDGKDWEPRIVSEMILLEHSIRKFEAKGANYEDAAWAALNELLNNGMRREKTQRIVQQEMDRADYIQRTGPAPAWLVDITEKRSLCRPG